jgi:hypothetical protein
VHDLPLDKQFLRVALLSKSAKELHALVQMVEPLLADYQEDSAADFTGVVETPSITARAVRKWVI